MKRHNQEDIARELASRLPASKKDFEKVLNVLFPLFEEILANGDEVFIMNFGKFVTRDSDSYRDEDGNLIVNPDSYKKVIFKPSRALIDKVKESGKDMSV